jgi:NADH:ubiquinone oxidoreductase subunit F (NADH-binding)
MSHDEENNIIKQIQATQKFIRNVAIIVLSSFIITMGTMVYKNFATNIRQDEQIFNLRGDVSSLKLTIYGINTRGEKKEKDENN